MRIPWAPPKDPEDDLDYPIDFTDLLDGDTITSATFTITPSGLSEGANSFTDTHAVVWLSGGTAGVRYRVTAHVMTIDGREFDRSIIVPVRNL